MVQLTIRNISCLVEDYGTPL